LDAQTTYHYRLVAENVGGGAKGEDHTFTTGAAVADSCPNARFRAEQGVAATLLPDCRAFEMVSPPRKAGAVVNKGTLVMSEDGDRVAFTAFWIPGAESEAGPAAANPYVAQRESDRWDTTSMLPPPAYSELSGNSAASPNDYTTNLDGALWYAATQQQTASQTGGFYGVGLDRSLTLRSSLFSGVFPTYRGASEDFSHIVISGRGQLLPTDPVNGNGIGEENLWELSAADSANPAIRLVDREVPGSPADGGTCGALVGSAASFGTAKNAVSADGSVIYFSAYPGCDQSTGYRIYARIDGTSTVEVSASHCDRVAPLCVDATGNDQYEGASRDGTRMFFSTPRQLVDGDTDSTLDLYEYDSSPPPGEPDLVQVSAGESPDATPAELQGILTISTDGSHVYFVAHGVLTTVPNAAGQSASQGGNNLYVYERDAAHPGGHLTFIATMAASETEPGRFFEPWSNGSGQLGLGGAGAEGEPSEGAHADGHILLFPSYAELTPEDHDSAQDLYRYDGDTKSLICVTCEGNGSIDVQRPQATTGLAASTVGLERHAMSEDGRTVVFTTTESLSPDDANKVSDVYEWRDGKVSLLSVGTGASGATTPVMSASGDDVAFVTDAPLLPQDTDHGQDAYDVRVDGGFPAPPAPPESCAASECQGVARPAPPAAPAATMAGHEVAPAPVFAIRPVTARQRAALARTGKITLAVAASQPGGLKAVATAKPHKKLTTVASDHARLTSPGIAHLRLRLSKSARAGLASKGKLTVRVKVSYSRVAYSRTVALKLSRQGKKKYGKKRIARVRKGHVRSDTPASSASPDEDRAHANGTGR
jgi:hypothetical protein